MEKKLTFNFALTGDDADKFLTAKTRFGLKHTSNTCAVKTMLEFAMTNPSAMMTAQAAPPAVDTKEEKARKQREGWVAFARIHNANDGKWHDYWDYRSELVRKFVDPSKEETQQQVDYRMREAAKFVLDWEAWVAGEFDDDDGELPPYQSGEK